MRPRVRWGILGTSSISETMVEAIKASQTSEVVAVASRDLGRSKGFAGKFSIGRYYGNYEALLNDPSVEAVYIGLPNHLHKEWILRSAKAGKHILCEKPLVINEQEAIEALTVVEKNGVICMEGLMYLHHPLITKLKSLIVGKEIGDIQFITANYAANIAAIANPTAGGAIRNLGCYPLSLIRLLVNQEPVSVIGRGRLNADKTSDHISMAILTFKNGVMASISTSDISDFQWQFEVIGTLGTIRLKSNPWCPDKTSELLIVRLGKEEVISVKAEKPLFTYQVDVLAEHIIRGNLKPGTRAVTWQHSIGNAAVLNDWFDQVKCGAEPTADVKFKNAFVI